MRIVLIVIFQDSAQNRSVNQVLLKMLFLNTLVVVYVVTFPDLHVLVCFVNG